MIRVLIFSLLIASNTSAVENIKIPFESWNFDPRCKNFEGLIISIVNLGVERIKGIRTTLPSEVSRSEKLSWSCPDRWNFGDRIAGVYSNKDHTVTLSPHFQDVFRLLKFSNTNEASKNYKINLPFFGKDRLHLTNTIFHEFLHSIDLKMKNHHNIIKKKSLRFKKIEKKTYKGDEVYSCSEVAFPEKDTLNYLITTRVELPSKYSIKRRLKFLTSCCSGISRSICKKKIDTIYKTFKERHIEYGSILIPKIL